MEANTGLLAGKFYVGPVEILNGLVKFPITAIQIMGIWSCRAGKQQSYLSMPALNEI